MPGPSLYTVVWLEEQQIYELRAGAQRLCCFPAEDGPQWHCWLEEQTAFAFVGQAGRLSVLKEARARGAGYWYAYRTQARHTRKHYLGATTSVTFARLEEAAQELADQFTSTLRPSTHEAQDVSAQTLAATFVEQDTVRPSSSTSPSALLASKLSPPRQPPFLVTRQRLLNELDAVPAFPLTLVSASAGSGKTTLLATWVATLRERQEQEGVNEAADPVIAWLSLEELDNDPARMWSAVLAALRRALPGFGGTALALFHAEEPPPLFTCLTALLAEIEQEDRDFILILDDYYVIEEQITSDALSFVLEHLPTNLHLVLSTRIDPALPLARWRVHAHLVEIRDRDLCFTLEEAASFLLDGMKLPLSFAEVALLHQRTEGWVAGLHLAALAMRKRTDLPTYIQNFAGTYRSLVDYVEEDILARLPEHVHDFLLQTSILTRLNARLCQYVTQEPAQRVSQQMLEEVERANLFLVPLDEQRQWYRYHDLFREVLCTRLRALHPDLVPVLHQRAARAYEEAGEPREALSHALAASDYTCAISVMSKAAPQFWLSREGRIISSWLLMLPVSALRDHIHLALDAALFLLYANPAYGTTSDFDTVDQIITRVEETLRHTAEVAPALADEALFARRVRLLRFYREARLSPGSELQHLAQEIEQFPADPEDRWNVVAFSVAYRLAELFPEKRAALTRRLQDTCERALTAGNVMMTIYLMPFLGQNALYDGQLYLARQVCVQAFTLMQEHRIVTPLEGYLTLNLFEVAYAQNCLEEAATWLRRIQQIAQTWQIPYIQALGEASAARLALAQADLTTAAEALVRMEKIAMQRGSAPLFWEALVRVDYWLASGNLTQAGAWAAQRTFPRENWAVKQREEALRVVRVSLAQQHYTQASEQLSHFRPFLDQQADTSTRGRFLAYELLALYHGGRRKEVWPIAARLLTATSPEGSIRIYLDLGDPMRDVLIALLAESEAASLAAYAPFIARVLTCFPQKEQAPVLIPVPPTPEREKDAPQGSPNALLSRQERKVFRLLIDGCTYTEIAETLVVSHNTIKSQVNSIYRKLGVSRRAEAIAIAHHHHLDA